MRIGSVLMAGLITSLVAVGCASPGSCTTENSPGVIECEDYGTGSYAGSAATCSATFSSNACPAANRVGRCVSNSTTDNQLIRTLNFYGITAMEAMTRCTQIGQSFSGMGVRVSFLLN